MTRGEELLAESRKLNNEQLLRDLEELTSRERGGLVRILARLSVLDERELAQEYGFPTLFLFCVRRLRYCESTAWTRSKAAEAGGRFPFLLDLVEQGELSASALAKLAPALTQANCHRLAREARGKSVRELDRLLAALGEPVSPPRERVSYVAVRADSPRSEPPKAVSAAQALQPAFALEPSPVGSSSTPAVTGGGRACVEILAQRTFTCGEDVEALLRRAKELLWHKYPDGRLEDILREALESLIARLDSAKRALAAEVPGASVSRSRRIPAWVRREVDRRDGDRCAFVGADGQRCPERGGLQYDHLKPWALGGRSDDPSNIARHCFAHNQWRARRQFASRAERRRRARRG